MENITSTNYHYSFIRQQFSYSLVDREYYLTNILLNMNNKPILFFANRKFEKELEKKLKNKYN